MIRPDPALAHAARQRGATWAAAAQAGGYASAGAALVGVRRWLERGQTPLPQGSGETFQVYLPADLAVAARATANQAGVKPAAWIAAVVTRRLMEGE